MKMDRAVFPVVRKNSPAAEAVGELCLDIEIYLEALEAVHAAGFGDGVQGTLLRPGRSLWSFQTAGNHLIPAVLDCSLHNS